MSARKHWALHSDPVCPSTCPVCGKTATSGRWDQANIVTYGPCGCVEPIA